MRNRFKRNNGVMEGSSCTAYTCVREVFWKRLLFQAHPSTNTWGFKCKTSSREIPAADKSNCMCTCVREVFWKGRLFQAHLPTYCLCLSARPVHEKYRLKRGRTTCLRVYETCVGRVACSRHIYLLIYDVLSETSTHDTNWLSIKWYDCCIHDSSTVEVGAAVVT